MHCLRNYTFVKRKKKTDRNFIETVGKKNITGTFHDSEAFSSLSNLKHLEAPFLRKTRATNFLKAMILFALRQQLPAFNLGSAEVLEARRGRSFDPARAHVIRSKNERRCRKKNKKKKGKKRKRKEKAVFFCRVAHYHSQNETAMPAV